MRNDDRTGEINDDPTLMREWSKYPIRIIKRDNIAPRVKPIVKTLISLSGPHIYPFQAKALAALKHTLQAHVREVAASFDND